MIDRRRLVQSSDGGTVDDKAAVVGQLTAASRVVVQSGRVPPDHRMLSVTN